MKRNTVAIAVLVVLLTAEGMVLVQSRIYLPNGIAPAVLFHNPSREITSLSDRDYVSQDPGVSEILLGRAETEPGDLSGLSDIETATVLRDWTRHLAGCSSTGITSPDPLVILEKVEQGECASCKPLADLYTGFLRAYGIPVRGIGLFESPGQFTGSHSIVEVWDGEKWVIEDPTFNCVAVADGGLLSVEEVQERYERGEEVEWVQDASATEPTIESYVTPPEELFNIAVYSIGKYWPDTPRWRSILIKLERRLTGQVDGIVLTDEPFPLPNYLMNGTIDRFLLAGCLICIIVVVIPPRKSGRD